MNTLPESALVLLMCLACSSGAGSTDSPRASDASGSIAAGDEPDGMAWGRP